MNGWGKCTGNIGYCWMDVFGVSVFSIQTFVMDFIFAFIFLFFFSQQQQQQQQKWPLITCVGKQLNFVCLFWLGFMQFSFRIVDLLSTSVTVKSSIIRSVVFREMEFISEVDSDIAVRYMNLLFDGTNEGINVL